MMGSISKLIFFLSVIGISGCSSCNFVLPKGSNNRLSYTNLMIYSDLSNRLNKSPNDSVIIEQIIDFFVKHCVMPGKKVNDRSSIYFSRVNNYNSSCSSANIDLEEIESLEKKQQFVNSINKGSNLTSELVRFRTNVDCMYRERDSVGLDILSLLYTEVNKGDHVKYPRIILGDNDTTYLEYENILFLFTDGYLEYDTIAGGSDFYFSNEKITAIREYCKKNKVAPQDAIRQNIDFRIRPLKSENNKFVDLVLLETYDRGLDGKTGTLKNSGDLSSNNILKCVWSDWAIQSDYKSFTWKEITKSSSLPNDYIYNIIFSLPKF